MLSSGGSQEMVVRRGDTAWRIAQAANRAGAVSLDQMLIAMQRANPDAFVNGNVNRLKAGAKLKIPTGDEARAIAAEDARKAMAAQARDFDEFRRRLAQGAPMAPSAAGNAVPQQGLQASVPPKPAPEKSRLTLSTGAIGTGERAIAQQLAREAERAARLADEIRALSAQTGASGAARAASVAQKPASPTTNVGGRPAAAPPARPASTNR